MAVSDLTGIKFITSFKYAKNMLKELNGLTFFVDPFYSSTNNTIRTFPFAFFKIKGIHEKMESEVQTKKVIFYDSGNAGTKNNSITGGLLNVIADNIVNKPKTYQLDVLIPYNSLTDIFNNGLCSPYQLTGVTRFLANNKFPFYVNNSVALATKYTEILKGLFNALINTNSTSLLTDFVTTLTETPMYNKNSLEAMWRNRTILKFKSWEGWNYKYVVITGLDISKEPTDEGMFTGTITCTEVPIMSVNNKGSLNKKALDNTSALSKIPNASVTVVKTLWSALKDGANTTAVRNITADAF